ncbi:MAG: hypothetical protein HYT87_13085 [Nitrospirae bacterium]|nr:hypothetical protein [Nitrospirota bacterium]
MSDRCRFEIELREEDLEVAEKILDTELDVIEKRSGLGGTIVRAVDESADVGHYHGRDRLAKTGMVYRGHHGPGNEFGACAFVGFGGRDHDVPVDHNGTPIVTVGRNGRPLKKDLALIRDYETALRRAAETLDGHDSRKE